MKYVILVFGLPNSGKTTLSKILKDVLGWTYMIEHLNADAIREKFNDWDFSLEGRKRQAYRIRDLAADSYADIVICDFVCPLKEYRALFKDACRVFIHTSDKGRFEDTNKLFEVPSADEYDFDLSSFDLIDLAVDSIVKFILFGYKAKYISEEPSIPL